MFASYWNEKSSDSFIKIFLYLCGCGWVYGTYFVGFWGFMAGYEAVAMGEVLTLG